MVRGMKPSILSDPARAEHLRSAEVLFTEKAGKLKFAPAQAGGQHRGL
jgi:hypothetical protein